MEITAPAELARLLHGRNVLCADAGARLVGCTSEKAGCAAQNALSAFEHELWLSDESLPQHVTVRFSGRPLHLIGWVCWHAFATNPRTVRVMMEPLPDLTEASGD